MKKSEIKLSIKQIEEMQHALGGRFEKRTSRNHFNKGSICPSWKELIKIGYATKRDMGLLGGITYFVTGQAIDDLQYITKNI